MAPKPKNVEKTAKVAVTNAADLSELRLSIGQSTKKVNSSKQEFNSTPESGTFHHIGTKEFTIDGKPVMSLGFYLDEAETVFVSENAIRASNTTETLFQIKQGDNKGLYMLKQERLSDLSSFGNSSDNQMINLVGKSFKTQKVDTRVLIAFDKDKIFAKDKTESDLAKLWDNTEPKSQYIFTIK